MQNYLRTGDIARECGITQQSVMYHIRQGNILPDATASGKELLFLPSTVEDFVNERNGGDMLDVRGVAEKLGISNQQVYNLVYKKRVLESRARGSRGRMLFDPDDVAALIKEG